MRLDAIAVIGLGVFLAIREYREKEPPRPWWSRIFK
jgi:hypothetical protein